MQQRVVEQSRCAYTTDNGGAGYAAHRGADYRRPRTTGRGRNFFLGPKERKKARDWVPRTHEEKQWSRLSTFSVSQVVIDIEEVVQIIYLKLISERIVDDPVPQIWK